MTPDENEMQTLSAIMHRLRAAHLCGHGTIKLSALLGGASLGQVTDVLLDVPACFDVGVCSQQITRHNIASFCETVRSAATSRPAETVVAFLNGRRSSYADGIIVLRRFILLLQEKQSIVASIQGRTVRAVSVAEVASFEKVTGTPTPFIFVFITDEDEPARTSASETEADVRALSATVVVSHDGQVLLLGEIISHLRQFALADSPSREVVVRSATASASASLCVRGGSPASSPASSSGSSAASSARDTATRVTKCLLQ